MTDLDIAYEKYLADFDPTPLHSGDGYLEPMTKATFEFLWENDEDDNDALYQELMAQGL